MLGGTDDGSFVEKVLESLTKQELEVAARTSYTYLLNSQKNDADRYRYARQFATRFLCGDGEGGKKKCTKKRSQEAVRTGLTAVRETLSFRTRIDVDRLRTCISQTKGRHGIRCSSRDLEFAQRLDEEMRMGNVFVQGFDRLGRSTYCFLPRNVREHNEWTIRQHVYTLERAIACSHAPDQTVNAVVDFKAFSVGKQSPPVNIGREFMTTFGNHYAAAIHGIYLVDVPTSFLCVWALFKPLLGRRMRQKIHFVKSERNDLSKLYDIDHVSPWMLKGGKKDRDLDVDEYLYQTPFDRAFDDRT